MTEEKIIQNLKSLSFTRLKEKIIDINSQLPKSRQNFITYSKNFTLSLSNYCSNRCGYCYYNHTIEKDDGNVILLDKENYSALKMKAKMHQCTEALLMSGECPEMFKIVRNELVKRNFSSFIDYVESLCKDLLKHDFLPHTNIGYLDKEDLKKLKGCNASIGLMLESTSKDLFKKGGVHENSLSKVPEKRIEHIRNAGKLKIPFTTGLLLGIGETIEDRIKDLFLIREIYEELGHIQEVIIQNFIEKEDIPYHPPQPITITETLRVTAIARIIFENEIAVQVPPNLIKGYEKEAIELGINDFGGVSPITLDYINPKHTWPQLDYLNEVCRQIGYTLKQRFPIYDKYIEKSGFCSESIKKTIDNIKINA
jgi:FO synthase subunit 1